MSPHIYGHVLNARPTKSIIKTVHISVSIDP